MTTEPDERVDKTLRDAFAVDEESVRRVSAGALAPPPRHRRRAPLVASLAAIASCVGLVAWLSRPVRHSPVTTTRADVAELTGSLVDGVLIVPIPGDGVVISGTDRRDDRPAEGSGVVLLEGGGR